jgi:hypothetical protein
MGVPDQDDITTYYSVKMDRETSTTNLKNPTNKNICANLRHLRINHSFNAFLRSMTSLLLLCFEEPTELKKHLRKSASSADQS